MKMGLICFQSVLIGNGCRRDVVTPVGNRLLISSVLLLLRMAIVTPWYGAVKVFEWRYRYSKWVGTPQTHPTTGQYGPSVCPSFGSIWKAFLVYVTVTVLDV